MDQPSEPVASTDVQRVGVHELRSGRQLWGPRSRDFLGKSLVWTVAVVGPGIASKNALEMSCIDDEKVVEALGSDRPDEALRIGVRVRCPEWGSQDLGALGPKDLVKARHVFRVAVADKEPEVDPLVDDVAGHIPRLLCDPGPLGMSGDAGDPDPSAADLDEEEDVEAS